jgi:hypothetical protein
MYAELVFSYAVAISVAQTAPSLQLFRNLGKCGNELRPRVVSMHPRATVGSGRTFQR